MSDETGPSRPLEAIGEGDCDFVLTPLQPEMSAEQKMRLLLEAASAQKGGTAGDSFGGGGPPNEDEEAKKRRRIQYALSALSKGSNPEASRRELEERLSRRGSAMSASANADDPAASAAAAAARQGHDHHPAPGSSSASAGLKTPEAEDGGERRCAEDPASPSRCGDNGFTRTFPQRLMEVLSRKDTEDAVVWMPNGMSFVIISPRRFVSQVLPRFFKQTKFASFTRKLNRWGFKRITKGPNAGAYYHALFQRDKPDLCLQMHCQKSDEQRAAQQRQEAGGTIQLGPAQVDELVRQRAALATAAGQMGAANPLLCPPGMNQASLFGNGGMMPNMNMMNCANMSMPMLTQQQMAFLQHQKMLDVAAAQLRMSLANMKSSQGHGANSNVQPQHLQQQEAAQGMGGGVFNQAQQAPQQQQHPHQMAPSPAAAAQTSPAMLALLQQQQQKIQALQAQNKMLSMQQQQQQQSHKMLGTPMEQVATAERVAPPAAAAAHAEFASPADNIQALLSPVTAQQEYQQEGGITSSRGTKLVNRIARGA